MTFVLDALRDRPQGIFQMDDDSPLQDYSGYNRTAVINGGTPDKHVSLVKGATYAPILTDDQYAEFSSNVFKQGEEDKAFTLSAAVRAVLETKGYTAQPYRENLVVDPRATNLSRWSLARMTGELTATPLNGVSTSIRGTITALGGQYVLGGGTYSGSQTQGAKAIAVKPNTTYRVGASAKMETHASSLSVHVYSFDSNGVYLDGSSATLGTVTAPIGTEVSASANYTTPATAAYITTGLAITQIPIGGTFLFSRLFVVEAGVGDAYLDGSMPGYEWTGTVNSSASRTRTDVARVNHATNPGSEGASGWLTNNASYYPITADTTIKRSGTRSMRSTRPVGAPASMAIMSAYNMGYNGGNVIPLINQTGQITLSFYVYVGQGTGYHGRAMLHWYNSAGTGIASTNGEWTVTPVGEWVRLSVTGSPVAGAVSWRPMGLVQKITGNAVDTDWVSMDEALVEVGSVVSEYFDGTSDGADWSGTPNASPSIMYTSQTEQQILGNAGQMDGLLINGNEVSFVTKYTNSGEARCSYEMQHQENALLHGIHTAGKNALYLNGELVAEVELTEAQQNDTFAATTANLVSGKSESGHSIAINAVAFYPYALGAVPIKRQYRASRNVAHPDTIASVYGGTVVPLSKNYAQLFIDQHWNSDEDWNLGMLSNVSVVNDEVVPQFNGEVSVAGYWYDSVALDAVNATSIYGVALDWEGEGVTVQVSLTGTSWETVERGRKITSIAPGYNPTSKVLLVRAHFPGGIASDPSYLANLNVYGILSSTSTKLNGRTVTYNNATPGIEKSPWDLSDNAGARIEEGGSITISSDAAPDGENIRTIEVWVKPSDTADASFGNNGLRDYGNGVLADATLDAGKWVIYHRVFESGLTGTVTIDIPGQIGRVVTYPANLQTADIEKIYAAYTGNNANSVVDSSIISITESGQAADIYAYDWEITGAG